MNVYIGLDIVLRCAQSPSHQLRQSASRLKRNHTLYYAPAHFEELLRVSFANTKTKAGVLDASVKAISLLTENNIIISEGQTLRFANKDPYAALKKCLHKENEKLGMTEIAVLSDKMKRGEKPLPNHDIRMVKEPTDNWPEEDVLRQEPFRTFIKSTIPFDLFFLIETQPKEQTRRLLETNLYLRETLFEIVFTALDIVNFCYTDPLHRNAYEPLHAMYASKADALITNDEKFAARCRLSYRYLGIRTAAGSALD